MKDIFIYTIGSLISLTIGIFSFSQIYGSLEYIKIRSKKATLTTLIFNILILCLTISSITHWFGAYKMAFLIALGIGCLMSCRHQEL